jgi:hypothetical protein
MKTSLAWSAIGAAALLSVWGCGSKKADVKTQTAELEKAFPNIAAVAPAPVGQPAPGGDPKACVSAALAAVKSNDLGTAVIMAKYAVRLPGLTPTQLAALQEARSAWMNDLMKRAVQGEASAKAALAVIDQAQ